MNSWSSWKQEDQSLTFEECDERLSSGWNVELHDYDDYCSGQRKRYLKSLEQDLAAKLGPDWREKIAGNAES